MVSKRIIGFTVTFLLIIISIAIFFVASALMQNNQHPVEEYARSKNLPKDTIEKLKPLDKDHRMDYYEIAVVDELALLNSGGHINSPVVHSVLDSIVKDGTATAEEMFLMQDPDRDYVTTRLEMTQHHTNPTKVDSDGGGIDDFNEPYTYQSDPNNPADDKTIIEKVPNVQVRHWEPDDGGLSFTYEKFLDISARDPLIQHLARNSEIRWKTNPNTDKKQGTLFVDGQRAHGGTGEMHERSIDQPSYYFTHGRTGTCGPSNVASFVILKLMDSVDKAKLIEGFVPRLNVSHPLSEALIKGEVYVVDYDFVTPREGFYEIYGFTPPPDYDPDWYK